MCNDIEMLLLKLFLLLCVILLTSFLKKCIFSCLYRKLANLTILFINHQLKIPQTTFILLLSWPHKQPNLIWNYDLVDTPFFQSGVLRASSWTKYSRSDPLKVWVDGPYDLSDIDSPGFRAGLDNSYLWA